MSLEPPDSPRARLDDNSTTSPFSGVVSISIQSGTYSGVLVARRFVLTAAHVIPPPEIEIRVNFNVGGDLTHRVAAVHAHKHPQFNGVGNNQGAYDLALIELSVAAPEAARTYQLATAAPSPGLWLQLVGYGASGSGRHGIEVGANPALRRVGSARITQLLTDGVGTQPMTYRFLFEPTGARSTAAPAGYAASTGLASGDSGSPAFVREVSTATWMLFGINSMVVRAANAQTPAFGYGTQGGGQILLQHRNWLRSVAAVG